MPLSRNRSRAMDSSLRIFQEGRVPLDNQLILKLMTETRLAESINAQYGQSADRDEMTEKEGCSVFEKRRQFRERIGKVWGSARINHLLEEICPFLSSAPNHRALIFSEFLCQLDVVEIALESQKIQVRRLDGSVDQTERSEVLRKFQGPQNRERRALLVTSKSGGEGIDMTAASRVFHISQPWNAAVIDQCNARAIRPNQQKKVKVLIYHAKKKH